MKLKFDPDQVHAILIGIETYAGGAAWTLDGPANSTLRMAEWLIEKKVPAINIKLFVNFSASPSEASAEQRNILLAKIQLYGVTVQEPARNALEQALDPAKLPISPKGTGTLLVYVCGHGLCSEVNRERYALTQEAHKDGYEALDLEWQCNRLRLHAASPRYPLQWIIHDACAEPTSPSRSPTALNSKLPDYAKGVQQYCIFATRPGEFAKTNPSSGAAFTSELLDVLRSVTGPGDINLSSVYDELERRFKDTKQHPTLYRRDQNGAQAILAAGKGGMTEATQALASLLLPMAISLEMIQAVYSDVSRSTEEPPDSIDDLLRLLESLVPMAGTALTSVERFALRLESFCLRYGSGCQRGLSEADCAEFQAAAAVLTTWINTWSKEKAAVKQLRQQLYQGAQDATESPIIVLAIDNGEDSEARAWRFPTDAEFEPSILPLKAGTLKERVAQALGQLGNKQWLRGETVIELVLPVEQVPQCFSEIDVVVEAKSGVTYRLGRRHLLLALRVAERWNTPQWSAPWKNHWKRTADGRYGRPRLAWLGNDVKLAKDGWYWVGSTDVETPSQIKRLHKALYEGAPFVAWCDVQHAAAAEVALTGHTYADLLQLLQNVGDLNEEGNLMCVVDDPERVPVGAAMPFKQPR